MRVALNCPKKKMYAALAIAFQFDLVYPNRAGKKNSVIFNSKEDGAFLVYRKLHTGKIVVYEKDSAY